MRAFASAERQRQFALGRLAVRRLVGTAHGVDPAAVDLQIGVDGAPRIPRGFVSIAHAGRGFEALGLAVLATGPIGVDAERIQPRHPRLGQRILRGDEAEVVHQLGGGADSALTLVWALKEAVLKGQRTGLRAGAQSIRLSEITRAGEAGHAQAESSESGTWRLAFTRQRDLWLAVALLEER